MIQRHASVGGGFAIHLFRRYPMIDIAVHNRDFKFVFVVRSFFART